MKRLTAILLSVLFLFSCKKDKDSAPITIKEITPMKDGPGAIITIKGTGFGNNPATIKVTINGTEAAINSISDTLIVFTVPEKATTGPVVVVANGKSVTGNGNFIVLPGKWTKMADLPGPGRADLIAFTIGNLAYVGLGFDGGGGLNDIYAYNATQNSWQKKADIPTRHYKSTGIASPTKGYIFCGANEARLYSKDVWEYDPLLDKWTRKNDFPGIERVGGAGFYFNNKIYFGLGRKVENLKDWWEYDPVADSWKQLKDFPGLARAFANAMVIGNKPHLGLGAYYSQEGRDWWEYNGIADTWVRKADFPGASNTSYSSFFAIGNMGYIAGGQFNQCWEYDVTGDQWKQKTSHPFSRIEGIGFAVGIRGYLSCGGGVIPQLASDLWSFDP